MVSRTDSRTFAIFVAASLAAHVAALAVWRMPPPVTDAEPAFRVEILPLQPVASAADLAAPAPRSPTPPPLKPAPAPVRAPAQQPAPAERAPDPPPVNAARAEPALTAAPSAPQETPRASDRVGVANAERRADAAVAPPAVSAPHLDATYLRNTLAYPTASVRNNEQGTVLVKVLVARDGTVSRAELEKSSGWPNLDMAAVRSIRTWRFVPARRGDEAIEKEYIVPAVFRLENVRR